MAADYMYPSMDDMEDMNPVMGPQMGYSPMMGCPFMQNVPSPGVMQPPAAMNPIMGCPFMQNMISPAAMDLPIRCPLMPYMINPMMPGMVNPMLYQMMPNMVNPIMQGMGTAVPSWNNPAMNPMMQMSPENGE